MKFSKNLILWVVVFMLAAVGVSAQDTAKTTAAENKADDVIAKVGDKTLTMEEVQSEFARIPPQFAAHFADNDKKEQYIRNMVDRMLFSQEAKKRGFMDNPEVQKKIDSYIERILYTEFLKKITEKVEVNDAEVHQYYDEHKDEFSTPERVQAKHILVKTKEEALQVMKELNEGADWDELAKKYSIDTSNKSRGGDLGYFSRGRMVKEFEEAAFNMKVGEVRGPIETRFGFHIIKLEDKKPAEIQPFEEVESRVKSKLLNEKRRASLEQIRDELYKEYNVKLNLQHLDEIKVGSGAAMSGNPGMRAMPIRVQPRREAPTAGSEKK